MEVLRIDANRMPKLRRVAAYDEIEWLDLIGVGLASVEGFERLEHVRATHGYSPHGYALLEA
jgi:hypothetical protein